MTIPDLIGLAGSTIVIIAYFAVAQGMIAANRWQYYLTNLAGAVLIFTSLWWAWNLPAAVVEIFWAAISIYGLAQPLWSGTK